MPHISEHQLLLCAGPVPYTESPLHDLVKVVMEMTSWSDREASVNLAEPPSEFNLLCKSCQIKDISRWRATQEITNGIFWMVLCEI